MEGKTQHVGIVKDQQEGEVESVRVMQIFSTVQSTFQEETEKKEVCHNLM